LCFVFAILRGLFRFCARFADFTFRLLQMSIDIKQLGEDIKELKASLAKLEIHRESLWSKIDALDQQIAEAKKKSNNDAGVAELKGSVPFFLFRFSCLSHRNSVALCFFS
jgi:septal ring factor EnvC (AmiA/AmiB activator)